MRPLRADDTRDLADTASLVQRWRQGWVPVSAQRWGEPPDPPLTPQERLLARGSRPELVLDPALMLDRALMLDPAFAPYPAHLHVDVLPEHQGRGGGRALLEASCSAVALAGAPAVHLAMDPATTGARASYDRLGFHELAVAGSGATHLGRATAPATPAQPSGS